MKERDQGMEVLEVFKRKIKKDNIYRVRERESVSERERECERQRE